MFYSDHGTKGCGGGGGSSVTPSVTPAVTLASLAITPANPSVVVGASQSLTLAGTNSDGTTAYITPTTQVIWTSSNPAVAMVVEGGGAVIGLAPGVVTITATIGSISGSTTLTVPTPTSLTFPVGTNPTSIAIDASGNAWITNFGSNNVSVLSSTGTLLNTIAVGTGPVSIAIDDVSVIEPDGSIGFSGNVWVVNNGSNNVTELSPSGTVLGTFAVGNGARGIFIDGGRTVWVVNRGDNTVTGLSPSGAVLVTYTVGNGPRSVCI
ncbi:MAG TPA: hypothetical protein DCP92_09850, partial [Nitrospiraceae bacterium]|nr:hypothetical protein [Nitrospiraceae bacterium]